MLRNFVFLALLQKRMDYGVVRKLQGASVRRPLFEIIVPNHQNAREDEYESTRSLSWRPATNASRISALTMRISKRIWNFLLDFQAIGQQKDTYIRTKYV